jgi:hypothetical protein
VLAWLPGAMELNLFCVKINRKSNEVKQSDRRICSIPIAMAAGIHSRSLIFQKDKAIHCFSVPFFLQCQSDHLSTDFAGNHLNPDHFEGNQLFIFTAS